MRFTLADDSKQLFHKNSSSYFHKIIRKYNLNFRTNKLYVCLNTKFMSPVHMTDDQKIFSRCAYNGRNYASISANWSTKYH